ncbi:MAG TPA: HAMP domain-containing sensor histidine kinase [Acidimicrobiales bacterium]|nr:HAMP domain-containing sensor histidine kinase [Acidimicrobiales bacterium]
MTLRLRLLLSVVAIVAAGLVISDLVTYNALRSFLITRVDQQLQAAADPVGRAVLSSSGLGPRLPGAPPSGLAVAGASGRAPHFGSVFVRGGADQIFLNGNHGPGLGRGVLVPPGTYGEIRSPAGQVEGHLFFSYGSKAPADPVIPARLPGSGLSSTSDFYFSTSSSGSNAVSYRAVAKPLVGNEGVIVIAVPLADMVGTLQQLVLIEIIVSALLLAGLGALSWFMVRRDLRPLEAMTATAGTIAEGDLSSRVSQVSGGTEVAQLGQAFNTMLDQIERAFAQRAASEERLRRFLADASHELRTPLTSILGYAELFDLGVRDRPVELATSMHHIRDEATRMGTLVDDLFLLAQLDHERPLDLEPVDLAALVRQSVGAVQITDPERRMTVQSDEAVWVSGDRSRLRQVVDNLVVNAQRHTPPGAAVDVAVRAQGSTAVLTVHDNGPGIDPSDVNRIFEPFFRSDPSRSRRSGGAGLGLAIVAAIVAAHRGTVHAEPGPGATFVVRLPTTAPLPATADEIKGGGDNNRRPEGEQSVAGHPGGAPNGRQALDRGPDDAAAVGSSAGSAAPNRSDR